MKKSMVVKGKVIGKGKPLVCVPIMDKTKDEVVAEAKRLVELGIEIIEWRVDAFENVNSLNEIIEYKGCLVFVDESSVREHLEEDEFLIDELVGLNVYDGETRVGSVVGVSNNGASDLLSVKTNSKQVCLVPFVKAIVLLVDIKRKRIQINNIEGLLS